MDPPPPSMATPPPTKITVLISGTGSNLQALIDAVANQLLASTTIVRVISNRKDVAGLARAQRAGIPTLIHNLYSGGYLKLREQDEDVIRAGREKYDAKLAQLVLADAPDLVVCAGFMHILAPTFLEPLAARDVPVINLHPARPKEYDGISAIKRAWQDYQDRKGPAWEKRSTGIMIHYVISEVDRGQPIVIRDVPMVEGESPEDLTGRVHEEEHKLIVEGTGMAIANLWQERRAAKSGRGHP